MVIAIYSSSLPTEGAIERVNLTTLASASFSHKQEGTALVITLSVVLIGVDRGLGTVEHVFR